MRRLLHFFLSKFRIYELLNNQKTIISTQKEILSAQVFNSTIADSEWLRFKSFSPGGWAADYCLLYSLYMVLSEMRPKNILEFGLGQSSKIIHQYARYFHASATTCEHDNEWTNFFNRGREGDYSIDITPVELEYVEINGHKTLSIKDVDKLFAGRKFDLIVVDAPFGSKHYSRPQLISLADSNLADSFCIIIDDYERDGEKDTVKEVLEILDKKGIEYYTRCYSSSKLHFLICSRNLRFLTSL